MVRSFSLIFMQHRYYIYDKEAYPNCFIFGGKFRGDQQYQQFEISDRMNQLTDLVSWLGYLRNLGVEMMGFNNLEYDYPILHELITNPYTFTYQRAFEVSQQIITQENRNIRIPGIKLEHRYIPQIDLRKINHFDNPARMTSLKALQFAMRSPSLEDLPFKIRPLEHHEKDQLKSYNLHDLDETERFSYKCDHMIQARREYLAEGILQGDVLNYSDVKIGEALLVAKIGRNKCYSGSKARGTFRPHIAFNKIILNKIYYRTEAYNEVLSWFKAQNVYDNDENSPGMKKNLAGLDFHFGVGGLHASADNKIFHTDDEYQIIDIDVAGMYVAVAIANRFAPEHLGESFVVAYKDIQQARARYPKGSSMNAALKLAGNGAYGKSNSVFSPMYDPQYLLSITTNGQLQILQLVEFIEMLPFCELIQANTDGITVRVRKDMIPWFNMWCREWEKMTGLVLEEVLYKRMWIRDVNNYIAEKMDGKLKLKGAYWYPATEADYEGVWYKDFSNLASIKAAVRAIVDSWPLEAAVKLVTDPFDFMQRYKATGESRLFIGDQEQLKTVRYYVSVSGQPMKKVSPPKGEMGQFKRKNRISDKYFNDVMKEIGKDKWDDRIHTKNKSKYSINETAVNSGYKVKECNRVEKFDFKDVDWNYYIEEAKKLIIGSK
jgi:hypothetical protein